MKKILCVFLIVLMLSFSAFCETNNVPKLPEGFSSSLDTDGETLYVSKKTNEDDYGFLSLTFRLENGKWYLSSIDKYISAEFQASKKEKLSLEYHAEFSADEIRLCDYISDENDNLLYEREPLRLPRLYKNDELLLDNMELILSSMASDADFHMNDSDTLSRLFRHYFKDYSYIKGSFSYRDRALKFLCRRPDGKKCLICGAYFKQDKEYSWAWSESMPLPEETVFGYENFDEALFYKDTLVDIRQNSLERFGIFFIISKDEMLIRSKTITNGNEQAFIGDSLSDIRMIDWDKIPKSVSEAKKLNKKELFASPNNPKRSDRLHLRKEADKSSPSLGKFYNGTILSVLKKGSTWTKVRIGDPKDENSLVGFMMTKFLSFDSDINPERFYALNHSRYPSKVSTSIRAMNYEKIPFTDMHYWCVIGCTADEKEVIVQHSLTGEIGYIRLCELEEEHG